MKKSNNISDSNKNINLELQLSGKNKVSWLTKRGRFLKKITKKFKISLANDNIKEDIIKSIIAVLNSPLLSNKKNEAKIKKINAKTKKIKAETKNQKNISKNLNKMILKGEIQIEVTNETFYIIYNPKK